MRSDESADSFRGLYRGPHLCAARGGFDWWRSRLIVCKVQVRKIAQATCGNEPLSQGSLQRGLHEAHAKKKNRAGLRNFTDSQWQNRELIAI